MPYSPQTWTDAPSTATPISAARLTVMETGIEDADTRITAVESGKQAADSDLTAIAALTPTDDDVMQRKAGAWANRTLAQLRTDIGQDTAAGTASLRTLGTAATAACAGNDTRLSDARTPTAHAHSGADVTSGTIAAARLPLVPNVPVTLTYAATLTPDAAAGNLRECTMTGDSTLAAPTNPTTGQQIYLDFLASTAARTLTIDAGITRFAGINSAYVIETGKVIRLALYRSGLLGAWVVVAKGGT